MIHITEVTTKAQLRQFVNFPIDLYRDVPQYIPGTYSDDLADWDREKNPAFSYCEARCWLASRDDGTLVGRIGAILSRKSNDKWGTHRLRFTQVYFIENREAAERIANQVLVNKRSRETAERTRLNTRKKLTEKIDIANRVQKFVDCRTKDVSRREIYIVEGDSALGACKQSRDAEFQGLMPVRGKILNCLKADYPRIFKSDVITDLMKVLGCGVEVQGKAAKELNQFDLNNLRWSKVVICTDGDVDGFQIRTLILTMLYRLCPTLIKEGYVYIAETPLFEITCKEKTWFAYSEKEKAEVVRQLEGKKYKVDRSKGLGENDPEMMWLTTMNPETRRLVKVLPDDAEETARVFDLLLGDNLSGRKDYIAENGCRYLDMIDVS